MYLLIIVGILVVIIITILLWLAFSLSAAYQQTLSIEVPFEETYRYVPNFNTDKKYKINKIKVEVTGKLKLESATSATITPGIKVQQLIKEHITDPYKNCLLIQEANTFLVDEKVLKRCPLTKSPTVENLSVIFFNKLVPLMPEIGSQLVSVTIVSEDVKVTHSRYKISDYSV